jgi:hypothetical protein
LAPSPAAKRSGAVPRFRIFYFKDSVLDQAEEIDARDVLEAIERVSGKPSEVRVEIWSRKGRVGIVGAAKGVVHG